MRIRKMRQSRVNRLNPRNQPRKRLDVALKGFALFAQGKPDVKYYHHAGIVDAGWDVIKLAERYGISNKLIITSRDISPQSGVSDEMLNVIYNVADVGLNSSEGEGFGLCFTPEIEVLTNVGYREIQNIKIGDYVFDSTGLTKVTKLYRREVNENILKLKLSGYEDYIYVTEEHPFLTQGGFVKAKDLTEEHHIYKLDARRSIESKRIDLTHYGKFTHTHDKIYFKVSDKFLGKPIRTSKELEEVRYLFNENLSKTSVRSVSKYVNLDKNLVDILVSILAHSRSAYKSKTFSNTPKVRKALKNMFGLTKTYRGKYIPFDEEIVATMTQLAFTQEIYLSMPRDLVMYLLLELLDQKSWEHKYGQSLILSARNPNKVRVLRIILSRLSMAYGEHSHENGTVYFLVNKWYLKNYRTSHRGSNMNRKEDVFGFYYRVLGIEKVPYEGTVHNFETESHEYNVYNYVVHNCNMEHAITGHPQIVGAHSANLELYSDDRGILLPIRDTTVNTTILTEGQVVNPRDLAAALEYAYQNRDEMSKMGQRSREFFLQDKFTWESVANEFKEVLE